MQRQVNSIPISEVILITQQTDTITMQVMKENEMRYCYIQNQQINMISGRIGYIHSDFSSDGNSINSTWFDEVESRNTPEFQETLNSVIEVLQNDPQYRGVIRNVEDMKLLCSTRPNSRLPLNLQSNGYGFRINTDNYAFLLCCNINPEHYSFSITAYQKEVFDNHIKNAEKGIRFINSNYKTLFTIPDGDTIQITLDNGEQYTRFCRYVDDYHFQTINGFEEKYVNEFHICQFAEIMERNGNTVIPLRSSLPDDCFVYLESTNEIALIKKGFEGYFQTDYAVADAEENKNNVILLNKSRKITPAQYEAMKAGSMFGWTVPAADPKNYDENGRPIKPKNRDIGDSR